MPEIYLRGYFRPHTLQNASFSVGNALEFQTLKLGSVELGVSLQGDVFTATTAIEVTQVVYDDLLKSSFITDHLELVEGAKVLMASVQRTVRYIKYFYGIPELDDRSEKFTIQAEYTWRDLNNKWHPIREQHQDHHTWEPSDRYYRVDHNFLRWVPILVEEDIEPLFGFTHLHKAFLETNTRHQWIDATTAAELGIKEFYGLYKPDLGTLLQHLPSPPLSKLYGEVLQSYTGTKSPMVSFLSKGAEQRNLLIHRPRQAAPGEHETDLYLHRVQIALMHLHNLLYPDSELFIYLLKRANDKLLALEERIKQGVHRRGYKPREPGLLDLPE